MDLRRIYQFAYAKTGNSFDAEDLSQEILLELLKSDASLARNPDAWRMGVCRHVWSRYLARNKRHWDAVNAAPALELLRTEDETALPLEQREEYDSLCREIAFLSHTRREVLIQYYFDGRSIESIARDLSIAPATVRWHMSKGRSELKGRMNVETRNGMRAPVQLSVGHSGYTDDWTLLGLTNDLLTQNIAWFCYGRKCTVEDLSRGLEVPAVYVESKLKALVDMDYLRETGGRYSTNFFILDRDGQIASLEYYRASAKALSGLFLEAAMRLLPSVRQIGFVGSDLPQTELLWHVLPEMLMHAYQRANRRLTEEFSLHHQQPVRPDGSHHWVWARVDMDDFGSDALNVFAKESCTFGIKGRGTAAVRSMQYDFALLGPWRKFDNEELLKLYRLVHSGEIRSEPSKEDAAALVREGYAEIREGRLVPLIPYMRREEHDAFTALLDNLLTCDEESFVYAYFVGYMRELGRHIPAFIDHNERNQWLSSFDYFGSIMCELVHSGKLPLPDAAIARRLSTIVWETE